MLFILPDFGVAGAELLAQASELIHREFLPITCRPHKRGLTRRQRISESSIVAVRCSVVSLFRRDKPFLPRAPWAGEPIRPLPTPRPPPFKTACRSWSRERPSRPKQRLHRADVVTVGQRVRGEGMAKRVASEPLGPILRCGRAAVPTFWTNDSWTWRRSRSPV